MSKGERFTLWAVFVLLPLAVAPLWSLAIRRATVGDETDVVNVEWLGLAMLGDLGLGAISLAILALIVTTPPDAIRLPPTGSICFIAIATAWLSYWGWSALGLHGSAAAAAVPVATTLVASALVRRGVTAWWSVVAAWNPMAIGFFIRAEWFAVVGLLIIAAMIHRFATPQSFEV